MAQRRANRCWLTVGLKFQLPARAFTVRPAIFRFDHFASLYSQATLTAYSKRMGRAGALAMEANRLAQHGDDLAELAEGGPVVVVLAGTGKLLAPFGQLGPSTWPVESTSGPNSVSLTVLPSTATLLALLTSWVLKNDPYFGVHARISGRST